MAPLLRVSLAVIVLSLAVWFALDASDATSIRDQLDAVRDDWLLDDAMIDAACNDIRSDGMEQFVLRHGKPALFVYAKQVFSLADVPDRPRNIKHLITFDGDWVPRRERLLRIVESGQTTSELAPGTFGSFDEFVKELPAWGDSQQSWVAFRDHKKLAGKKHAYTERVQLSGLCFMHAPVVLQHYLVAMQTDNRVPSLDIARYMRRYRSSNDLHAHIMTDGGGSSAGFAETILVPDSRLQQISSPDRYSGDITAMLEQYGPALLSGFMVDEDFRNTAVHQHLGERNMKLQPVGMHAMLVVGHRQEGNSTRLLVQNWWRQKPFIEVDTAYLTSTKAQLNFALTPQPTIPEHFPTSNASHVELELDFPEQMPLEYMGMRATTR